MRRTECRHGHLLENNRDRQGRCKTCNHEYHRNYWKTHPERRERVKAQHLKDPKRRGDLRFFRDRYLRYGISKDEYINLFNQQYGKCKICEKDLLLLSRKKTYLDHNHITGKIRGFLCPACNSALGLFKDSIELMQRAINYVKET